MLVKKTISKNIYIFTNIAPHYREALWFKLLESKRDIYNFVFGEDVGSGIKYIDFGVDKFMRYESRLKKINNVWVLKKFLIWQSGVVSMCVMKDIDNAIFLNHIYCLSTWIASIVCRIKGVEVVYWGHGFYGSEKRIRLWAKKLFYRLAQKHLLYERRAKEIMSSVGFDDEKIYVVFNSLDYDKQLIYRVRYQNVVKREVFSFFKNPECYTIVFIGRLTVVKKIYLLFRAVLEINDDSEKFNLLIIGDGEEREKLELMGANGIRDGWLFFKGALYDEEEVAKYLSASDLCVSPGDVGLTGIHSLSYGTPVCTHGDLTYQMPEAEAIVDGYNGFYFERDNVEDLKKKIKQWFSNVDDRMAVRRRCYEIIDSYYNPYYQLEVFSRLVGGVSPDL